MNNQNPIIPPGSVLEQKNRGRARVRVVVFSVLGIHVLGVMAALLMQGCKQEKVASTDGTDAQTAATSAAPPTTTPDTAPPAAMTNPAPTAQTPPVAAATPQVPAGPPTTATPPAVSQPPGTAQDYVIVQGDSFSSLSKKFGVSTRAIMDANPGVEPTKLQIGQKVHIPAPTVAAATTTPSAVTPVVDTGNGEQLYTVKSNDTLTAIARQFGVRVRAIRTANNLTTDRIIVGQKLKIPAKPAATAAMTASNNHTDPSTASPTASPQQ